MARSARPGHGGIGMNFEAIRHVVIRGRVQGVGYRAFTEYTALDHGLEGWVRNRRDGSVEAVFARPAQAGGRLIQGRWRGPPGGRGAPGAEVGGRAGPPPPRPPGAEV